MNIAARLGLQVDETAGQVAVITGAGQGIGREAALALSGLGAKVVVADINAEAGAETVRQIQATGGTAAFVRTDVSREADVARLAMWTLADFGPAHILINAANDSPELACRMLAAGMQLRHQGTVINIGRDDTFSECLAAELAPKGICVVTLNA
ncbi:MAG: short-chain dehydrogenase/reductase [Symbiobacteriaceae bacterium]|jgi:NAD(P)-dependent dehydrogenase (short-subunit alcohol dehydrogenase family)|nr:short-chain dehydrogenase/reductase [Symbiobacteriaceae bacterium]